MTRKNMQDIVVILPGYNRSIDQNDKAAYEQALAIERKYLNEPEE
jgi:hypothetical protein